MATRPLETERTRLDRGGVPISELPRVLAIIVTHNGRPWFKHSVAALNNQTYAALDVLVVDDASPDARIKPTLKRIAKRHLKKRRWGHVRTPRPLGFGGAINWALSRVKTDADLLLFLHDDAEMDLDAVEKLVGRLLADDASAIVGPKVVDWEDPDRLEEIGMAIDSLGYPYKGLEENEIDLGQHDQSVEVFFVTSTCMLMKHDVFRELRGWDARLRAFSEDLDLCWRARIAGHAVRVEPAARVKHAIALARGERRSPFRPQRYYIRRNRLRTIAKNASGVRLLALLPFFFLLALVEMLGFIILRQFAEIPNLARALAWNFFHIPQTIAERARVQRRRTVPDRRLKRLTVRETTRMRAYGSAQAARLEEAWGRRADVISRRGQEVKTFAGLLRGRVGVLALLGLIGFALAFRHLLWGPSASVGELLPYPDSATAMWRAFGSPWRGVGLGQEGLPMPALALLGVFPVLTFGAAGAAQKLLVLVLGGIAFSGAYRLVAGLVDRPSRLAAGAAYAAGAVGYAGIRYGALGALVFGAAAPWVLTSMLRLIGWMRPAGWVRGRSVMRVILGSAVSAAFVPGSLVFYLVAAVLLAAARNVLDRGPTAVRGMTSSIFGLVAGWVLLLPWSATWLANGGVFDVLRGDDTWRFYAESYAGHGMASVFLGQTPDVPALFGLALPLLGLVALVVGEGQRRRAALAFWALIVADGWLVTAIAAGWLRPIVANPTEAGVLGALAFSGLVGLAVGAFRLDLGRRSLGLMQPLALGALALAAFLVVSGLGPSILGGAWGPGRVNAETDPTLVVQLRDLLQTEAHVEGGGEFRVLWVGNRWESPSPSVARPHHGQFVTGSRGELLTDIFETTDTPASRELDDVIASIRTAQTDVGGRLLGTFNIRFVVLDRTAGAYRWLGQRDLALVRSEDEYVLLENRGRIERAAVYPDLPPQLAAVEDRDPTALRGDFPEVTPAQQVAASRYVDENARGPGAAVVTEAQDPGWRATFDGQPLERVDAGWANAFEVPSGSGTVELTYPRSTSDLVWYLVVGLGWVVVIGGAFSRRRPQQRSTRAAR
ncbi:MAG: glycosyltransferase [Actinomycetota bacterium]